MRENPNIILAGFMATGKTTVGREIADLTGFRFVDADTVLEQRFGMSVPAIFEEHGEGRFREEEAKLAVELSFMQSTVIATGGGMILNDGSRGALEESGEIFCLNADTGTLSRRVESSSERPLLAGAGRPSRIAELLESRKERYESIGNQVKTDNRTPLDTALFILGKLGPSRRRINIKAPADGSYPVFVGRGLSGKLDGFLSEMDCGKKLFIVTDSNVHSLHTEPLIAHLTAAGFRVEVFAFPAGEKNKSIDTVNSIHSFLAANSARRDSFLIALGGGVVGDTVGFAASTYMRGIPLVHIPTTLMAQCDSSIGGKNAVNRAEAKNLVGTFYQPSLVIADPEYLRTLPAREFRSGLAEVVKTAIIEGESAFRALEILSGPINECRIPFLEPVIFRCLRQKAAIVSRDPFEKNERRVLNLGHTFGHAFEQRSGYGNISHGEAVALGIRTATAVSRRLGKISEVTARRITDLLHATGLLKRESEGPAVSRNERTSMLLDKKAKKGGIVLVLPVELGVVEMIEDIELSVLRELLEEIHEEDTRHSRP